MVLMLFSELRFGSNRCCSYENLDGLTCTAVILENSVLPWRLLLGMDLR